MTIEDYALELGVDTSLVISKLKELGFKYNNVSDFLDDEAIIMLDNEMGDLSNKENNFSLNLGRKALFEPDKIRNDLFKLFYEYTGEIK